MNVRLFDAGNLTLMRYSKTQYGKLIFVPLNHSKKVYASALIFAKHSLQ